MSNTGTSPPVVSPSLTGSTPVTEVLQRLPTRDPQRKNLYGYSRRMGDFELHWHLSSILILSLIGLVGGVVLLLPLHRPVHQFSPKALVGAGVNPKKTVPPIVRVSQPNAEMPLGVPRRVPPAPPALPTTKPKAATPFTIDAPEGLHANFVGVRTLEVSWQAAGDGYRYQLFSATNQGFENAQPILKQPVSSTQAFWIPDDKIQSAWVAVQAIDAEGHLSPLSRPVLVHLPPA